jgi:hypothetical protein
MTNDLDLAITRSRDLLERLKGAHSGNIPEQVNYSEVETRVDGILSAVESHNDRVADDEDADD